MENVEDRSSWPTKQDVARELHYSERSLELKIKKKEIRADTRSVPDRKPLVILHPEDVEALRQKRVSPKPMTKREIAKLRDSPAGSLSKPKNATVSVFRNLRHAILAGIIRPPLHEIRWLSLTEAAAFTGLPRDFLKESIETNALPALTRGRRILVKWTDLAAFRPHGEIPKAKPSLRNGMVVRPQIIDESSS